MGIPAPAGLVAFYGSLADQIRYTNEALRREVEGRDIGYFIDIFSATLGRDGRSDDSLFLEDGLNVSPKGYLIWKRLLSGRSGEIL